MQVNEDKNNQNVQLQNEIINNNNNMSKYIHDKCSRCLNGPIDFMCEDCPQEFNVFCSVCDTAVHSIILSKRMHTRAKLNGPSTNPDIIHNNSINIDNHRFNDEIHNTIDNYNKAQKDLNENEIQHLNAKMKIVNQSKDTISKIENKFIDARTEMQNSNHLLQKEKEFLSQQEKENKSTINELRNELETKNNLYKILQSKYDTLMNEYNMLKVQKKENEDMYEFKLNECSKEKDFLMKELSAMKSNSNTNLNQNESLQYEICYLKKQLEDKQKQIEDKNQELYFVNKENKALIQKINQLSPPSSSFTYQYHSKL
jgi:DNA repair exonuclease SbcCD ATPase subunit